MSTMTHDRIDAEHDGGVLADLLADSWFQAQHSVQTWYGTTARRTRPSVTAYDAWDGEVEEIHAHLTEHPAF